jgi:tetratricopeptide (TPR) repeat protein
VREQVTEDLRRRYEQRLSAARGDQIQHYIDVADAALTEKNVVSAANALRIATSLAPDDKALAARLEEVQLRANQELADSYLDQAQYEERNGRKLEAAASYERAARGKPSASVYERAAACLLEGEGDLRRAAELAKKSVELAPKAPEPRATLAKIYANAGMKDSALLEFERAGQLAPDDDSIKDWIKRLKRGEA